MDDQTRASVTKLADSAASRQQFLKQVEALHGAHQLQDADRIYNQVEARRMGEERLAKIENGGNGMTRSGIALIVVLIAWFFVKEAFLWVMTHRQVSITNMFEWMTTARAVLLLVALGLYGEFLYHTAILAKQFNQSVVVAVLRTVLLTVVFFAGPVVTYIRFRALIGRERKLAMERGAAPNA